MKNNTAFGLEVFEKKRKSYRRKMFRQYRETGEIYLPGNIDRKSRQHWKSVNYSGLAKRKEEKA